MMNASTTTMRRFGPSGSLIKVKATRERTSDVIPKMISGVFLGLWFMGMCWNSEIDNECILSTHRQGNRSHISIINITHHLSF